MNEKEPFRNVVFLAQAEYLYFFDDFRLKTFFVKNIKIKYYSCIKCFDTAFSDTTPTFFNRQVISSLTYCHELYSTHGLWIEVYQNLALSQIDITKATIDKKN